MKQKVVQNTFIAMNVIERSSRLILCALCAAIVAFSGLYIYLIINTISNTAARTQAERRITALNSNIGEMESSYISEQESITMDMATTLGFVSADKSTIFVARQSGGKDVALR